MAHLCRTSESSFSISADTLCRAGVRVPSTSKRHIVSFIGRSLRSGYNSAILRLARGEIYCLKEAGLILFVREMTLSELQGKYCGKLDNDLKGRRTETAMSSRYRRNLAAMNPEIQG